MKLLHLTDAGNALIERVDPAAIRVQERLLAPLAAEDRTRLMRLLEQLVDLHHDQARTSQATPT